MNVPFSKYHGAGNDFILIDNRYANICLSQQMVIALCDRRKGIGADGVVLLETSSCAHYRMRIYNADGSEPTMCGNGLRCLIDYIGKLGDASLALNIEISGRILTCSSRNGVISVNLGVPHIHHWPIVVDTSRGAMSAYIVNTGVPHAVVFVDNVEQVPISVIGRELRFHPSFAPEGVNVDFVQQQSDQVVMVRTYERGVEGETLACGTGAAAAAFVAAELHGITGSWSVMTKVNLTDETVFHSTLFFIFPPSQEGKKTIEMTGSACHVFTGSIQLEACSST